MFWSVKSKQKNQLCKHRCPREGVKSCLTHLKLWNPPFYLLKNIRLSHLNLLNSSFYPIKIESLDVPGNTTNYKHSDNEKWIFLLVCMSTYAYIGRLDYNKICANNADLYRPFLTFRLLPELISCLFIATIDIKNPH